MHTYRRYPTATTTSPAHAHVSRAWEVLLDSAYGGYREGNALNLTPGVDGEGVPRETESDGDYSWSAQTPGATAKRYAPNHSNGKGVLADKFSKDGLARFPSLTLILYTSPNTTGLLEVGYPYALPKP